MEDGVYLLDFKIENLRGFSKQATLNLSTPKKEWKKWNIILGNNGTGKTTILQSLAALEYIEFKMFDVKEYYPLIAYQPYYKNALMKNFDGSQIALKTTIKNNSDGFDVVVDFSNKELGINIKSDSRYEMIKMYGYGANRFMSRNSLTD